MGQRNVRVVVGQGDPDRHGFLRTVLEDDGFDVVGEATTTSPLARLLTDERPDVVVLDDAIGVSAVELTAEIVPSAKIIVVWPAAVVPIAGATRVDPSEVLQSLAATVAVAAGIGGPTIDRPEWIEQVRKDPATLRELLAARGGVPTRPSVTELQRRGHRLHPSPGSPRRTARPKATPAGKTADDDRRAVVTPIGLATPLAASAALGSTNESWNRRLGVIALGGAAVAGALVIALASSNRAPSFNSAQPLFIPPIIQPTQVPPPPDGGGQQQGGDHTPSGGGGGTNGGQGGGTTTGGSGTGTDISGGLGGPLTPPITGGGTGGSGPLGGNPGGPRTNHLPSSNSNGNGNGNGNGGNQASSHAPGRSGSHNPHGGPPGWEHRPDHPAHGANAGGQSAAHGGGNSNAGGNSSNGRGHSSTHADKHVHKQ